MKALVFLFIVLCVISAQFQLEKPEQIRLVSVGNSSVIPPYKKKGKFKGYQRNK